MRGEAVTLTRTLAHDQSVTHAEPRWFDIQAEVAAVSYDNGLIHVFDDHTGRSLLSLTVDGDSTLMSIALSPSGRLLAVGYSNQDVNSGHVSLWNVHTGKRLFPDVPTELAEEHALFSADEQKLAVGGPIEVGELDLDSRRYTSAEVNIVDASIDDLALQENGTVVIAGGGWFAEWDGAAPRVRVVHCGCTGDVMFAAGAKSVTFAGAQLSTWNVASGLETTTVTSPIKEGFMTVTSDLVLTAGPMSALAPAGIELSRYDPHTYRLLQRWRSKTPGVSPSAAFKVSQDGVLLGQVFSRTSGKYQWWVGLAPWGKTGPVADDQ